MAKWQKVDWMSFENPHKNYLPPIQPKDDLEPYSHIHPVFKNNYKNLYEKMSSKPYNLPG